MLERTSHRQDKLLHLCTTGRKNYRSIQLLIQEYYGQDKYRSKMLIMLERT